MKKTARIFTIIFTLISLACCIVAVVYMMIYGSYLVADLTAVSLGGEVPNIGSDIGLSIMFLCFAIYFSVSAVTGMLTRRVLDGDLYDRITRFGVLSIIFFNPVGGILAIVYNRQLKAELERTAPKGKRKEIQE